MNGSTTASEAPRRSSAGVVWFVFMVAMWVAFFCALLAGSLDDVWSWVRDLPLPVELVVWVLALPWLLATAVWESSWPGWLRLVLVVCFAVGWTAISIPRRTRRP
jgi:hypothetical protein